MGTVIPFPTRQSAPQPRYQVDVDGEGNVALCVDGELLDSFEDTAALRMAEAFRLAAEVSRARRDVRGGHVAVACGRRRHMATLCEHRGTVVLLDLGGAIGRRWFALTDGTQTTRSAATRRWSIEAPHLKALRNKEKGTPNG